MATYKRRIVYLSDEEWAELGQRAKRDKLSVSAYIRWLMQDDPLLITQFASPPSTPRMIDLPTKTPGDVDRIRRRFNSGMFTPVPKPAPRKKR